LNRKKNASITQVAIVVRANTYLLYVCIKTVPSPMLSPTTAQAAIILLRQIPFPAEAPTACNASMVVSDTPMDSAAMTWISPKVRLETVVDPEKKEPKAPSRGQIMINTC
jgi:hypothetical protein